MAMSTSQHRLLLGSLEAGIRPSSGNISSFEKIAVIVLSAMLCSLLLTALRCAIRFRHRFSSSADDQHPQIFPLRRDNFDITFRDGFGNGNHTKNIGTAINTGSLASRIPETVYGSSEEGMGIPAGATECPICLAEFERGERVRVIPGCGHGFHVECIDAWFGSHSSCPVCRQRLTGS